jgi:hypothetical protein
VGFGDPLEGHQKTWAGFWRSLAKYLAESQSVFRLYTVRNQPIALLRSGDRRTSVKLQILENHNIVAQMRCHAAIHKRCALLKCVPDLHLISDGPGSAAIKIIGGKVDPFKASEYSRYFDWVETTACRFRAIREGW